MSSLNQPLNDNCEKQRREAFKEHLQCHRRKFNDETWKEYKRYLRGGLDPRGKNYEQIRRRKRDIKANYRWDGETKSLIYKNGLVAVPEHQIYDTIGREHGET